MNFVRKIFPAKRCNVCRREKNQAKNEQVEKLVTCGVGHCPFQEFIEQSIKDVLKPELLQFDILPIGEVLEDTYINVIWKSKNCKRIFIANMGEVALSGQQRVRAELNSTEIEIILEDLFGETFSAVKPIKILPKPSLEIIEVTDRVLKGEGVFVRYEAKNFRTISLRDEFGNIISDITGTRVFISPPFTENSKIYIHALGLYGGEIQREVDVKVFEPPIITAFNVDNLEKVDTLPIYLRFEYHNASKVELFCDGNIVADVTGSKSYIATAMNTTDSVLFPKFELIVTGLTGKQIKGGLSDKISVYPQPRIIKISSSPDNIILYPTDITLTNLSQFCEKIILSDGENESTIEVGESIVDRPQKNTAYKFIPIGKQNFYGKSEIISIDVFHPIDLVASPSNSVTLPNRPVRISWNSKNHTHIFLEPGHIDITNREFYDVRLESKAIFNIVASNKKDKKTAEVFIDVLPYPKVDKKIFGTLPELNFHIPNIENIKINIKENAIHERKPLSSILLPNFLTKTLESFKVFAPKTDSGFQRSWRDKMFAELKSKSR